MFLFYINNISAQDMTKFNEGARILATNAQERLSSTKVGEEATIKDPIHALNYLQGLNTTNTFGIPVTGNEIDINAKQTGDSVELSIDITNAFLIRQNNETRTKIEESLKCLEACIKNAEGTASTFAGEGSLFPDRWMRQSGLKLTGEISNSKLFKDANGSALELRHGLKSIGKEVEEPRVIYRTVTSKKAKKKKKDKVKDPLQTKEYIVQAGDGKPIKGAEKLTEPITVQAQSEGLPNADPIYAFAAYSNGVGMAS